MAHGFSEYGYVVRKPGTPILRHDNDPVDAGESAELFSNLTHLADEAGQVWACDGLVAGRYIATVNAPTGGGTYILEHMARVKVLSIRTRPVETAGISSSSTADGGPYKLRVRIGGAISAAGTVTFYGVLGPAYDPATGPNAVLAQGLAVGSLSVGDYPNATSGSTSSTTEAWLTLSTNVVYADAGTLSGAWRSAPSLDNAGYAVTVQVATLAFDVYGYSATNGVEPRLYGLYCAEWIG